MISNNFCLSRLGRSLSLQSCFPETKSAEASIYSNDFRISIESSHGDITHENNIFSFKTGHGVSPASNVGKLSVAAVQPETSDLYPSTCDVENFDSSVLQVGGNDTRIGLNQSTMQGDPIYLSSSGSNNLEDKTHMVDDFTSFPLSTVPHSGAISGEIRGRGLRSYVVLYFAALKGDWQIAKEFLSINPQARRARITRRSETALHIAAGARHTKFVEELVKLMSPEDLVLQNKVGNTALCFAAASGIRKIAEVMVNGNRKLPSIRGSGGALPLYMAALLGHKDMVWYLYSVTEALTEEDHIGLLIATITANLFDVALDIIQKHPELATARDGNGETALHVLARKPSAFLSGNQLTIWQRCLYSCHLLGPRVMELHFSAYKGVVGG